MHDKKNIWIINQYAGSPHHGMNYRSYYLAKEFLKEGHDVHIFAGSYSHLFVKLPKSMGMYTEENIDGISYTWIKTPKYKKSKSLGRIWNMLVFMFKAFFLRVSKYKKPSVIIVSSLSIFPVINAYIWSKLFKVPFIFEVRDIWPLTLIEVGGVSRFHPLVIILGWFEKWGYKKAKYVVSVLPYAKKHMVHKGMNPEKFQYIPNGIRLEEVENYEKLSPETLRLIPKDKFIVGYIGTIGIANALEYILQAAKELSSYTNIHFVFVGGGGQKEVYQKYCEENSLSNVTLIDPIQKIEVQSMLKEFDVCYLGWHKKKIYEYGISANKIFDYMYSAKPILHSISVQNDIIQDAGCGISVEAEDIKAIQDAIVHMSTSKKRDLEEMGVKGKEYVIRYHAYNALAYKYLTLI